jgi:large subunit ribosomal protein L28
MSNRCSITQKCRQYGHRVSHANNKTKHVFLANIQNKRVWIPQEKRMLTIRVSTKIMRTIDKIGLEATLRKHSMTLADLM